MRFEMRTMLHRLVVPVAILVQTVAVQASLTVSPPSVTVRQGGTSIPVTATVTLPSLAFSPAGQTIVASGLPPGVAMLPSPVVLPPNATPSLTSVVTLRFTATSTATPGTYAATLTASSGLGTTSMIVTVTEVVAPPTGDIDVAFLQPSMSLCNGGAPGANAIRLTGTGGYSGAPSVTVESAPPGLAISPLPPPMPMPPDQTIPFTVTATNAAAGPQSVTFRVTDATRGISKVASFTIDVGATDFTALATPASLTLTAGGTPQTLNVSVAGTNCFNVPVLVTQQNAAGLTISPAQLTLPAGSYAPQPFTIAAQQGVAAGTYPLVFQFAAAGLATKSVTVPVTILAGATPDFQLTATPAALAVIPGGTAYISLLATPINGYSLPVTVIMPADADVTFNAAQLTLTPGVPQTLQIAIAPNATPRTASLTFTGRGAGVAAPRIATVTVDILPPPDFRIDVVPSQVSIRSGTSATVNVSATSINSFTAPIVVSSPAIAGITFTPPQFTLTPGASQMVTVAPATPVNAVQTLTGAFTAIASGITHTAPFTATLLPAAPLLRSATPPSLVNGAVGSVIRVAGENFHPAAHFAFSDPRIRVLSSTVLSTNLADIVVAVHDELAPGAYALNVTNPDGGTAPQPLQILVYPRSSLGAPLDVTAAAIVFPANGTLISDGDALYPRALLATTGLGTITGAWLLDGVMFDRFTVAVSAGTPAEVHAHVPLPQMIQGGHRLSLVIETPKHTESPVIEIVQTNESVSRLAILAPRDRAVVRKQTQFRWSLVPNASGYLLEFTDGTTGRIAHRVRLAESEWTFDERAAKAIGTGVRRWRVRPVFAGETLGEPTEFRSIGLVPESVTLVLAPPDVSGTTVEVRWTGGAQGLLYRVDFLGRDGAVLFSGLTPQQEYTLRRELATLPADYRVQVTAIAPGNIVAGISAPVSVPQVRKFSTNGIRLVQIAPSVTSVEPREATSVSSDRPHIAASWSGAVSTADVSLILDQTDVTAIATITPVGITLDPLLPLAEGPHRVALGLGAVTHAWTFNVSSTAAAAPGATPATAGAKKADQSFRNDWVITPGGTLTLVRDANDDLRFKISGQHDLARGPLTSKATADVSIKRELDAPRRTIQESRNWIGTVGAKQQSVSEELTVGYAQPDFLDQAQLVTTGLARGGVQGKVRLRFATASYYQTFSTRPSGLVTGTIGPEQKLRAFALQRSPSTDSDLRLVALETRDDAGFNSAGGKGTAIGIFARRTLGGAIVMFEAARGKFDPDAGSALQERSGNAFRLSLTGTSPILGYALNLRRTDADFVNPANRGFTAGGVPDRTGGDLTLTKMIGRTSLSAQLRHLRDGNSSGQLVPSVRESGANASLSTTFGQRTSFSLNGTLTTNKGDARPDLFFPRTDRKLSGLTGTLGETLGRLTLSQTVVWQKMDDRVSNLADQTIRTATFSGAGSVSRKFNVSAVLSGTRSEGNATIGRTDQILFSLQPSLTLPALWLSLQPRAMIARSKNGVFDTKTTTEQYAALVSFNPPYRHSLLSLQLSADWSRNRVSLLPTPDFTRRYVGALSFSWGAGNGAAAQLVAPGPFSSPVDPLSREATPITETR